MNIHERSFIREFYAGDCQVSLSESVWNNNDNVDEVEYLTVQWPVTAHNMILRS